VVTNGPLPLSFTLANQPPENLLNPFLTSPARFWLWSGHPAPPLLAAKSRHSLPFELQRSFHENRVLPLSSTGGWGVTPSSRFSINFPHTQLSPITTTSTAPLRPPPGQRSFIPDCMPYSDTPHANCPPSFQLHIPYNPLAFPCLVFVPPASFSCRHNPVKLHCKMSKPYLPVLV